jgi:hypothetical protein
MRQSFLLAAAAACSLASFPVLADVIDGEWCSPDGRHLTIKGPELVTPTGKRISGDYGRHSFLYVVPPADPGSGETVAMRLVNEETVHLRQGRDAAAAAQAPVQVWKRCSPGITDAGQLSGDDRV